MNNDAGKICFDSGLDISGLERDIRAAQGRFTDLNSHVQKECTGIDGSIRTIGTSIAAVFTVQKAGEFIKKMVTVRGEVESLEKSFGILAGKTKGKKLFADIKDFAVTTPMAMGDLAKGAQTLLSFNVAADEVMPIMRAIGDIAMGDAQKFNSLTLAFAQMQSTGKLMGQDLLQMINAGFNPLSIIAEKTGKSIGELKEEMSSGAISADMIKQAFMDATAEGGKFHGMLEAQSQGIKGSISNLEGAIEDMFNSIGEKSQGFITGSIQTVTQIVQNYEKVGRVLKDIIIIYGTYKAALIATTAVQKFVVAMNAGWTASELLKYKALLLVEKAQKLLNATMLKNPYVLAVAAIAGLVFALYKLAQTEDGAKVATKAHAEAIDNLNQKYEDEKNAHESVISLLNDETISRMTQIQALEGLDEPYRKIIEKYQDEKGHISDVIALQKELSREREKQKLSNMKSIMLNYQTGLKYAENGSFNKAVEYVPSILDNLERGFGESEEEFMNKVIAYIRTLYEKQSEEYFEEVEDFNAGELMELTDKQLQEKKAYIENEIKKYIANVKELGYDENSDTIQNNINDIKQQLNYDGLIKEIERRNAGNPELVKNKTFWEQYVKEQQAILNAMTEEQLLSEEAANIRSNIIEGQKKIDLYNVKEGNKKEDSTAQEIAERNKKIKQYGENVAREARQAELDIEQARIDGMEEGIEKELAQNELNYNRLIEENKCRQEEMVEALRDVKQLEWENANPDFKEKGMTFDRSSITANDLSSSQKAQLSEYERIAGEQRVQANRESFEKILTDVKTYEQKRMEIEEEYERKRAQLYTTDAEGNKVLREGVTQDNVDNINQQEEDAINELNGEIVGRSAEYQRWLGEISQMTVKQLRKLLETAKTALNNIKNSPNADPKKIAEAEAKVFDLESAIENAALSPAEEEFQQWELYGKQLDDVGNALASLGDDMGGVAGDALSMLGTIMSSTSGMIENIANVAQNSMKAMSDTSNTASKAIAAAQNSVAILAIIQAIYSAVIALRDFIDNNFNTDDNGFGQFASDFLHFLTDSETMLENLAWSLLGPLGTVIGLLTSTNKNSDRKKHQQEIEDLIESYEDLAGNVDDYGKIANESFGASKEAAIQQQIELKRLQIEYLKSAIAAEQSVKKPDQDKIDQWNEMIDGLNEDISDLSEDAEDAIFGESTSTAIENFGNALADAWANGENASEAANKYMRDMIKQTVMQAILDYTQASKKIDALRKLIGDFLIDGVISEEEQAVLENKAQELMSNVEDQFAWAEGLFSENDFSQNSTKKGFEAMSQDTADELNGRFTAIQIDTNSIKSICDSILINSQHLISIIVSIKEYSDEIRNISLSALGYLETIARNTHELYEMNKRLGKIEINTRNL